MAVISNDPKWMDAATEESPAPTQDKPLLAARSIVETWTDGLTEGLAMSLSVHDREALVRMIASAIWFDALDKALYQDLFGQDGDQ